MSNLDYLFEVRDYLPSDKAFIKATFLRGLYYGDSWFSFIPKDIFMHNYSIVLDSIIDSPNNVIAVACLKEDPSVILGYSVMSSDYSVIHWVFVKKAWRKQGIGRTLVPKYPTYVSHLSQLGKELLPKFENTKFNPFALGLS